MARLGVLFVSLLLVCRAGHAQSPSEIPAVSFFPEPRSKALLPIDASGGKRVQAAEDLHGPGKSLATREELSAVIEKRLAALEKEHAVNGERSSALIGDLTSLAAAYQEIGDYTSATSALQDAIGIARINYGLHSLDQADAVESLMAAKQAAGDHDEAERQRDYLRDLARRNADDARIIGILDKLAAEEMEVARRSLGMSAPPVLMVRSTGLVTRPLSPTSPSLFAIDRPLAPKSPSLEALYAARADYTAAIEAADRTHGNAQDLFAIQDALVDTVYFEHAHAEMHGPDSLYTRSIGAKRLNTAISTAGTNIMEERLNTSIRLGRAPVDIAEEMLEIGDWDLVYNNFGLALGRYEDARELLVARGVPGETIDGMLSPEVPPVLPVRGAGTVRGDDRPYRGYIDASVEITRFGIVKRVAITDKSAGTSRAIEKSLRHWLASSRFRPRFVNGALARSDTFDARFYFDY